MKKGLHFRRKWMRKSAFPITIGGRFVHKSFQGLCLKLPQGQVERKGRGEDCPNEVSILKKKSGRKQ